MRELRIHLLERFQVTLGWDEIPDAAWRGQTARSLLQYLALCPNFAATRDQILDALWPDMSPNRARQNLYVTVNRIRQALAGGSRDSAAGFRYLLTNSTGYRLAADVFVDVHDFYHRVQQVRSLTRQDAATALTLLEREGPTQPASLLPDHPYTDWAVAARDRFQREYVELQSIWGDLLAREGRLQESLEHLLRVLELEPVRESVARQAMELATRLGDRVQALQIFDRCRQALAEELGVEPLGPTLALHTRILQEDAEPRTDTTDRAATLPGATPSIRHNLPAEVSSFVGRRREMADIKHRLAEARLVTLTGTGGCGKTRLALRVADDLLASFSDGIWLVALGQVSDANAVPQAVASVLDVQTPPGQVVTHAVADFLRPREVLLLLDNCDHLVESCADLAHRLMRSCHNLRIMATSRQVLGLRGEAIYPVLPLPVSTVGQTDTIDNLMHTDAVRLFVERARAVLPGFTLTDANSRAVAQICRRVDGIPLALELAAAWANSLAVEQIAARLNQDLRMLVETDPATEPRQRTMEALCDWSYQLLSAEEQTLWQQTSVFVGGFTLDAAEVVCAGNGLKAQDILGILGQLVAKSLVHVDREETSTRYRLLEPLREYAAGKLGIGDDQVRTKDRHGRWYLKLVEEANLHLTGPEETAWFQRLEKEKGNWQAALEWFLGSGQDEEALRLGAALSWFWINRHPHEAFMWLPRLLRETKAESISRGYVLTWAGALEAMWGRTKQARPLVAAGHGIFRAEQHQDGLSLSPGAFAVLSLGDGEPDQAWSYWQEQVQAARKIGAWRWEWAALANLATIAVGRGDLGQAAGLTEEALAAGRRMGTRYGLAYCLGLLGRIAHQQERYQEAFSLYQECLPIFRGLGDKRLLALHLRYLAETLQACGDVPGAMSLYRETLVNQYEIGHQAGMLGTVEKIAHLLVSKGQMEVGVLLLAACDAEQETSREYTVLGEPDPRAVLATAKAAMGEDVCLRIWAKGCLLSLEQATVVALGEDVIKTDTRVAPILAAASRVSTSSNGTRA